MAALKIFRAPNVEAAAQAIDQAEAEVAFTVGMLHDNPPGDWYIEFTIISCNAAVADRVARAQIPSDRQHIRLRFTGFYTTDKCCRAVERRPEEETEAFLRSWDPVVEATAARIQAELAKV